MPTDWDVACKTTPSELGKVRKRRRGKAKAVATPTEKETNIVDQKTTPTPGRKLHPLWGERQVRLHPPEGLRLEVNS